MKLRLVVMFTLFLLTSAVFSQQNIASWNKLNYLIGNWKGEGNGIPGEGGGYFTFKLDLDQNILVRTSHTEYPATKGRPATNHNDLMIIYRDYTGTPKRAIYFDNENHVINYSITYPNDKDIVFISDKIANVPTFRLTYSIVDEITVNIRFEMSQDGEKYFTYVEGKSKRAQ
jgi:hypothetical protein